MKRNLQPTNFSALSQFDITPERRLVLACCRSRMDAGNMARLTALLQDNLDWAVVMLAAARHGVQPLLCKHLESVGPGLVPEEVRTRLRRQFGAVLTRNMNAFKQVVRLQDAFKSLGVLAVPYKGPILARMAYGDLALRQFGDLDYLVHRQDFPAAKRALMSAGYRPEEKLAPHQERGFLYTGHHMQFVGAGGCRLIELHWRVMPRFFSPGLETDSLLRSINYLLISGCQIPVLSPAESLLVACLHGTLDHWRTLHYVCDIAELARSQDWESWMSLLRCARNAGVSRMVGLGLLLASGLLEAPVPREVLQETVTTDEIAERAEEVCRALIVCARRSDSDERVIECMRGLTRQFHLRVPLLDRSTNKMKYSLSLLSIPRAKDWSRVPRWAPWKVTAYLLRGAYLARKCSGYCFGLVRKLATGWQC